MISITNDLKSQRVQFDITLTGSMGRAKLGWNLLWLKLSNMRPKKINNIDYAVITSFVESDS
jgi:hypothetical protein